MANSRSCYGYRQGSCAACMRVGQRRTHREVCRLETNKLQNTRKNIRLIFWKHGHTFGMLQTRALAKLSNSP